MSAVILQMVLRKRIARAQATAALAERDAIVAQAKGDPALVWRGEWQKDTDYLPGDAVASGGSSYIATEPSSGKRPKQGSSFWNPLALKGKDGKNGKDGVTRVVGAGGAELASLELTDSGTPQSVAVKIDGTWVQLSWSAFLDQLPATSGLPAGAITVNGVYVTVNG